MIRRPPRSTLFPSAPLSRSTKGGSADAAERAGRIYREQLEDYEQPPIDDGVREALREYVARRRIELGDEPVADRKSTRLNSSHGYISYAVFCLKKKTQRAISSPRLQPRLPYVLAARSAHQPSPVPRAWCPPCRASPPRQSRHAALAAAHSPCVA